MLVLSFVMPVVWGLQDPSPEREGSCGFTASCLPSVGQEGHLFRRDSSGALGPLCHMYGGAKPPALSHTWDMLNQWTLAEAGTQSPHNVRAGAGLQPRHSTNIWDRCICRMFKISHNVQLDLTCYQLNHNHAISWPGQKNLCKLFLSYVAHSHPHATGCFSLRCVNMTFCLLKNVQYVRSLKIYIKTNPLEQK